MDEAHLLNTYADRGTPRGADAVLEAAREASDVPGYVDLESAGPAGRGPRSKALAVAAGIVALLAIAGIGFRIANGQGPSAVDSAAQSSDAAQAVTKPSAPTAQEQAEAERRLAQQIASGWVPWTINSVVPAEGLPQIGFMHTATGQPDAVSVAGLDVAQSPDGRPRAPVYDKPDGKVLGYYYVNLGFVPAAVADAPGFDVAPLFKAAGRCAPNDQSC